MRFRIVEMYSLKILIRTNLRLNVVFTENHNLMKDFTLKFVLKVFWCYQGLINGSISQKWVNVKCFHRSLPFCLFYKKKIPWQLNSACLLSNCLPVIHGSLANVKQRNIYLVTDFIKLSVVSLKMFSRTQKI